MITVYYSAVDGFRKTRKFKTLKGARKFAHDYIGPHPEIGRGYAVSGDGVGKIEVDGAALDDLFPATDPDPSPADVRANDAAWVELDRYEH